MKALRPAKGRELVDDLRGVWQVNRKRAYRLYIEEDLQIRNKRPKRKVAAKLREDRKVPMAPNQLWAMDFLLDQLFDGSKIRIPVIVDAFFRLSPAIAVRQRYRASDVVDTLNRVTAIHGMPKSIRVGNGPEFISKDPDLWAWSNGVTLDFSRPGKPTDNAFVESSNGKVRAECIDQDWFLSPDNARSNCTAERIQRGTTAQCHREQDPCGVHEIHRATQPPDGLKNRKFGLRQVQHSGQGHYSRNSNQE